MTIKVQTTITVLGLCYLLGGCAHSGNEAPLSASGAQTDPMPPASPPVPAAPTSEDAAPTAATSGEKKFPWMRPPAPIAGRWNAPAASSCGYDGMVIEIEIPAAEPTRATGRIIKVGKAARLGYRKGEVVMQLEANDFGNWRGKVKWRSVLGVERWDPAYLVLEDTLLRCSMCGNRCWDLTRR